MVLPGATPEGTALLLRARSCRYYMRLYLGRR
jgi:hypothetical protein